MKKFILYFIILLLFFVYSCATVTNKKVDYKPGEYTYIFPFLNSKKPGMIFLFNKDAKPQLRPIHSNEWLTMVVQSSPNISSINNIKVTHSIYGEKTTQFSSAVLGSFISVSSINADLGWLNTSMIDLDIDQAKTNKTILPIQLYLNKLRENDPYSYEKLKEKIYDRVSNKNGTLVAVQRIDMATKGKYTIKLKEKLSAGVKSNVKKAIKIYGGVVKKGKIILISDNNNPPFPYKIKLEKINLDTRANP